LWKTNTKRLFFTLEVKDVRPPQKKDLHRKGEKRLREPSSLECSLGKKSRKVYINAETGRREGAIFAQVLFFSTFVTDGGSRLRENPGF